MKNTNYWEQFMQSGRVEDYLYFCRKSNQPDRLRAAGEAAEGEDRHAGFYHGDGYDIKDGANRGI